MGILTEPALAPLVERGCPACGGKKLVFRTYVDGRLPVIGGEPCGSLVWMYDGEAFVEGVFEVTCAACKHVVLADPDCPRCRAPGGLARALESTNAWPAPKACPSCGLDQVKLTAMLPARVVYEGKRAEKARTTTELLDPGFHAFRVDCADCGKVAELTDRCPLCG